jgi:hypothetical protein
LAGSSSDLWKWHRKLGHLSFDLLSRLSKLNLVRGLPRLRLEKELVCAPCRHAKMVDSSHPPLTDVMTERPCELLHMDLVGGLGMGAFSILPSSKPVHLDLKVTSNLVRMRGRGGGRPKLGGATTFSGHYAAVEP